MNINRALRLHKGDCVTHPASYKSLPGGGVRLERLRITEVWINAGRTIVMIRIHAIAQEQWLDATAYEPWQPEAKQHDAVR